MEKEYLKTLIRTTETNFNFKLTKDFTPLFEFVWQHVKEIPTNQIEKKFQQLWLLTNNEWHSKFNLPWGGYPSLAQWLEILAEKPLTEQQIEKKKDEEKLQRAIQKVREQTKIAKERGVNVLIIQEEEKRIENKASNLTLQ